MVTSRISLLINVSAECIFGFLERLPFRGNRDEIFELRKSAAACRPYDSMIFHVSMFAKVALYRRD
jgi:hypothetical protein